MVKNKKTSLGRGLDSLIPVTYDKESSNDYSNITLEDILDESKDNIEKNNEEKDDNEKINNLKENNEDVKLVKNKEAIESIKNKNNNETQINNPKHEIITKETVSENERIKVLNDLSRNLINNFEENDDSLTKIEINNKVKKEKNELLKKNKESIIDKLSDNEKQSIEEVIEIISNNPRITLWSAKSAAVFRYLRKTKPEFSISKEASELIDEAVQNKYPEIWSLFEDMGKKITKF